MEINKFDDKDHVRYSAQDGLLKINCCIYKSSESQDSPRIFFDGNVNLTIEMPRLSDKFDYQNKKNIFDQESAEKFQEEKIIETFKLVKESFLK